MSHKVNLKMGVGELSLRSGEWHEIKDNLRPIAWWNFDDGLPWRHDFPIYHTIPNRLQRFLLRHLLGITITEVRR